MFGLFKKTEPQPKFKKINPYPPVGPTPDPHPSPIPPPEPGESPMIVRFEYPRTWRIQYAGHRFTIDVEPDDEYGDVEKYIVRDGSKIVLICASLDEAELYCWMQGHR
jgi:hypothetical protein